MYFLDFYISVRTIYVGYFIKFSRTLTQFQKCYNYLKKILKMVISFIDLPIYVMNIIFKQYIFVK